MNIKPLRKPARLILSDEELAEKSALRSASSKLLLEKGLADRFKGIHSDAGLLESYSTENVFRSTRNLSDYVCHKLGISIVSDERGKIADILLTVPGSSIDSSDERHLRRLIELMFSSDPNRHFTVLCHPYQVQRIDSWFSAAHFSESSYSLAISTFSFSIWAQDAYIAMSDQNGAPILCEGVHFPRYDDPTIADDVSAQTNKSTLQSYLYFQGGNILEAGEYILVGRDYIEENLGRAHLETEEKVLSAFESLLGKPVISVGRPDIIPELHRAYLGGGYYQPIFHIDMYISPTGKKTQDGQDIVVVASPRLGREAIGEASRGTDYDIYFDEAADQLAEFFHVVRIPILPSHIDFSTESGPSGRYYYLSFNNAVIENYGSKSNIYLPTFSEDVDEYLNSPHVLKYEGNMAQRINLDRAAKKAWEDLGFTVYQMDGLEDLAIGWGSVHCITKTLVRQS